ncbi:MAG: RNA polymerase sigma factor [Ferruginibacter sp.]
MDQPEIIERLKRGDETVYTEVVERWQDMIYNTAISIVQNEEDAEDITQEVFVTLYERIDDFRQESTLSTWLYSITIRKALDLEKRRSRLKHGGLLQRIFAVKEADEPANFNHPGILLDNKETATVLFSALKKLPEKQRVAFTLHKMEGLNYQQIAGIMDTSLYAIESLQVRAKNNLKKILKKYYEQQFNN